jgi:hypothetical protein
MRTYTPVLAATTLIGGIVATYLWTQLRAERDLSAQLQARVAQLEVAHSTSAAQSALPLVRNSETQDSALRSAAAPASPPSTPTANALRSGAAPLINTQELLKDPDFRDGMAVSLRSSLAMLYPDLAKDLGLTPEQSGKLLDLLSKHRLASVSAVPSPTSSDPAAMREFSKAVEENSRKEETEVRSLLGDAKYEQWKEYQSTLAVRQQVSQLRSALQSSGQALDEYQEKSLITALAAEQKRETEEARRSTPPVGSAPRDVAAVLEDGLQRGEANNKKMLDVASSYLTASQLEVMGKVQNQQLSMMRAMARAQRAQANASAGSTADTTAAGNVIVPR